ncbi:MAG: hypothetical protein JJU46_03635 [Balneolaceae bacterium]|nr:hypothetical protein [Balneolaceae bacterium]MCH8548500.1 hypothetical protein [Balneolaceae bacterium]
MKRLTREKAIELLPAVVDNEASEEETIAFLAYIETDELVRQEYRDAVQIKRILARKYPRKNAPEHLREKILEMVNSGDLGTYKDQSVDEPVRLSGSDQQSARKTGLSGPILRYLSAAAVILIITLITIELLDRTTIQDLRATDLVENYAALHFTNAGGQMIDPHYSTSSVSEAEAYISEHHGIDMTVPELDGAEFAGLVIADFYNGLDTPLLAYHQPDIDETIYIFSFKLDNLEDHKSIKRSAEAVKNCITHTDFYVSEIDGHHVVSWLWNDIWYSAVSNHNGYDLASIVKPLNYSP